MANDTADKVLVELAARGDGDSFTELCRRYYGAMVAIGHAIIGDRHLAEDAAQQAFAKAAVNLPRLRKPEQFGRWVAAICRNEARDLARVRRGLLTVGEPLVEQAVRVEGVPPSDRGLEACDTAGEAVKKALGRLPVEAKEVVYLRFYDGLSYEQISAVLGIMGRQTRRGDDDCGGCGPVRSQSRWAQAGSAGRLARADGQVAGENDEHDVAENGVSAGGIRGIGSTIAGHSG